MDTIDVRETRVFGIENYLVRRVPAAVGALLVGVLVIALPRFSGGGEMEGLILGSLLVAWSLAYIARAYHRRAKPKQPIVELSPDGILYRIARNREFRIPWREVRGVGLIDIQLRQLAKLQNVTVASVSREFFDANVPANSWWNPGPVWRHYFFPTDDMVQIAFYHDLMSVSAEELWNEIETRWRVFSGHPDAPILPVPRLPKSAKWLGGWTPPPAVQRAGLAALAILALPAIYFWHWPVVWLSSPDVPHTSGAVYLRDLLDGAGVQARLEGNGIVLLRGSDISAAGPVTCGTEIARDANRSAFLPPVFAGTTLCTAALRTAAGAPAYAIFKLVVQTTQSPDWQGRMQEYRSLVPEALDENEADAALCRRGSCKAG
ncbi:MAG: hypothetical protein H0T56_09110 [Pseudaminobacter sp.]|nr:hypothetical protein [Pseudaminobacter sp.]